MVNLSQYQEIFNKYLFPDIGSDPIDQINRGAIRDLLLKYHAGGFSKGSVRLIKDGLSGPLSFAVDEGLIPTNNTTGIIKRLNMEKEQANIEPLTHEEVDLFLGACQKNYPEHYPFFLCAFRTGMRLGELLALRWGDVNSRFIRVSRSYKLGQVSSTKTNRERRVDMSNQLTAWPWVKENPWRRSSKGTESRWNSTSSGGSLYGFSKRSA